MNDMFTCGQIVHCDLFQTHRSCGSMWCRLHIVLRGQVFPSWDACMSWKLHLDFAVSLVAVDSVFVDTRADCCVVVTCVLYQGRDGQKKCLGSFLCHFGTVKVTSDLATSQGVQAFLSFSTKALTLKPQQERRKSQGFTPTFGSRVEFPNIKSFFNRRSVFNFSLYNFPLMHCYLVTSRDLENSISVHIL